MEDLLLNFFHTTFSESGRLEQIDHALMTVKSGQTSIGIIAADGVVIATEKKLPSILFDESSVQKIQLLTDNSGLVYSGHAPDSRALVRKIRKQAQAYIRIYNDKIPVRQLVRQTADVMQEYSQAAGVRPFGVSLLIAGYDDRGPQLFQVDPSGSFFAWKAAAIGRRVSRARAFLEKKVKYSDNLTLEEATLVAISTLKRGFEGEISAKNIEIGTVKANTEFRLVPQDAVEDLLAEANKF